jgi:putative transcriptional regulator
MPQLQDPNFTRTVILLCQHNENGAFGIVVNRPLVTSGQVIVNVRTAPADIREPEKTLSTDRELEVWVGGPVEPQRSWILVGGDMQGSGEDEARGARITDDLYLSTSPDLLRRLLEPDPPRDMRLIIGYSGWGPGQLEAELQASAWLLSDVDRDLIFNTPPCEMWERAIRRLGADPASLQMSKGVH